MTDSAADPTTLGIGLLLVRIVIGPLMAAHGAQKLLGWFGGPGLRVAGEHMSHLGFRPGRAFAAAAAITEVASGVLITLGFLGPIGPALMLSVMIVAAVSVHARNGVFAAENGIELNLLYAAAAVALAIMGFGAYSVDAWLGMTAGLAATSVVLAGGAVGGIAMLGVRRPASTAGA